MTYEEELSIFMKRAQDERYVIYAEMNKTKAYQKIADLDQKLKKLQKKQYKEYCELREKHHLPPPTPIDNSKDMIDSSE